ncbi:MAG: NigD-like protein [Bacteroidales bacterium]
MRKLSILFATLIISISSMFTSCDNDEYSLDKFWVSFATVKTVSNNSYYLQLDNGETLWPAAQGFHYTPTNDERVLANYTILSDEQDGYDHFVKVNSLSKILTKGIIELTTTNQDSIGNDKVVIEDIWFSGEYLNIIFGYNTSYGYTHYINLVNNTTIEHPEDGKIHLEFRHNRNKAPETYGARGVVSFKLDKIFSDDQSEVTISVKANEFKGEKSYDITINRDKTKNKNITPLDINVDIK